MTEQPHSTQSPNPLERWRVLADLATDYLCTGFITSSEDDYEAAEEYAIAAGEEWCRVRAASGHQPLLVHSDYLPDGSGPMTVGQALEQYKAYRAAAGNAPRRRQPRQAPPPTVSQLSQGSPPSRRQRQPRQPHPGGLLTAAEAAARLRISVKTLNAHVATREIRCVVIGQGKKRPRRRYADADLDEFIANQTRKDSPCPSTRTRVRRTGNSISDGEVIAFTAQPRPRPGAKPKK